jgi:hypothetical protein
MVVVAVIVVVEVVVVAVVVVVVVVVVVLVFFVVVVGTAEFVVLKVSMCDIDTLLKTSDSDPGNKSLCLKHLIFYFLDARFSWIQNTY